MENIEYLKKFFIKHKLSGKIKVRYEKPGDDYMSDIVFENGKKINIKDVIFDIESELDPEVAAQWIEEKYDMSLIEWVGCGNKFLPKIDTSSLDEYKKEIEKIMKNVKKEKQ